MQTQNRAKAVRKDRPQGEFRVTVTSVDAPDAQERMCRAFDLVLRAAARAEEQDRTQATAPAQDGEQEGAR